jgi:hypothetical protein
MNYKVNTDMVAVDYPTRVAVAAEWLPIVGEVGFALYSLYACMLALGIEIGGRKIAAHMSIGHASFRRYNRLLEVCDLIRIEQGSSTTPSKIVLKEPKNVSPAVISDLYARLLNDDLINSTHAERFRSSIFTRLENYSSLYQRLDPAAIAILQRRPQPEQVATNGGTARPAPPAGGNRYSDRIARSAGVSGKNVGLCAAHPPALVLAVALEAWQQPRLENPPGFIVSRLREENPSAGADLLTLAEELLKLNRDEWAELRGAVSGWRAFKEWDLPADFCPLLDDETLDIFGAIYEAKGAELAGALGY